VVAELSSVEDTFSTKKMSAKWHKHTVESKKETSAYTDSELSEKTTCTSSGSNEEQKKCRRHSGVSAQRPPGCKLFKLPETGLYEYFLAKLKRQAHLAKMRKQLVKHEGKLQYGKVVMCISRKNLAKVLSLLDKVNNSDNLKNRKKQTARRLSKLLQTVVHL